MQSGAPLWRPSASLETIRARAELYGSVRAFFFARGVMEVDTPVLSAHAAVDRNIESMQSTDGRWLQTSPEFAMKRLLCAGSGPIFQIAPVFRAEEAGRFHNPEFRLLEWYRPGWDHHRLMAEVEALIRALIERPANDFERVTYREAFIRHAGLDPFAATLSDIEHRARQEGYVGAMRVRDEGLDVLMSLLVGPRLGLDAPVFLHDFPASQSALARIRPGDPPVAERFELFWKGLELANGFHELTDPAEQRARFESDQTARGERRQCVPPFDAHLIDALRHGLPDCAGVALGLDRLLMLKLGLPNVADTMTFDWKRA
ncbi:MAG: EF-P lysine aminoacylase EpmA [Panacagrimonas sp.]